MNKLINNKITNFIEKIKQHPQLLSSELIDFICENIDKENDTTQEYLLILLLPKIIPLTNSNNSDWLTTFKFNNTHINIIIDNLDKFNLQNNNLLSKIFTMFYTNPLNDTNGKKLIDKSFEHNLISNFGSAILFFTTFYRKCPSLLETALQKYITDQKNFINSINFILDNQIHLHIIYQNIDFIFKNIEAYDLFVLKKKISDIKCLEPEQQKNIHSIIKQIKQIIITKEKDIITFMLKEAYFKKTNSNIPNNNNLEIILELAYLTIKDICKNENISRKKQGKEELSIADMDILNTAGGYSTVFSLGDKVIKISGARMTTIFPNNPYVIAMALRKEWQISDKESLFIEVTEKVDTNSKISNLELYQLYKKIRNLGLLWTDVKTDNVGRLLKDNIVHWNISERHQELKNNNNMIPYPNSITDQSLGLSPSKEKMTLKAGEIVILDNDYIYDESQIDENTIVIFSDLAKKFESQYQSEKKLLQNYYQNDSNNYNLSDPTHRLKTH